jgi:hypothetical protein
MKFLDPPWHTMPYILIQWYMVFDLVIFAFDLVFKNFNVSMALNIEFVIRGGICVSPS